MSLAEELLAQARLPAALDPYPPVQANLRRAVSSAYYAVFHLFSAAVAAHVVSSGPPGLRERTQRALSHGTMGKVAQAFSQPGTRPSGLPADICVDEPISVKPSAIAKDFKRLQEERHAADCDVNQSFDWIRVLALVETAEEIFANWNTEKTSNNAFVFLSSPMFWERWNQKAQ